MLLDASALIRLYKCESLDLLTNTIKLAVAEHVHGEFEAGGPAQRAALGRLAATKRSIVPGSPEWKHFTLVRKEFSTVDLGEDQSIAIALAEAERVTPMPIVCYDHGAVRKAHEFDVATVSFLATLAWLISCDRLSLEQAEEIEKRATARDGWKRPATQIAPLESQIQTLCEDLAPKLDAAKSRRRKPRS